MVKVMYRGEEYTLYLDEKTFLALKKVCPDATYGIYDKCGRFFATKLKFLTLKKDQLCMFTTTTTRGKSSSHYWTLIRSPTGNNSSQRRKLDSATLKSVAYMIPVIAVRKGNPKHISGLTDMARPGIRIAITRPETTLVGHYAPEIFEKAGLTAEIEKNIVTHALRPDSLLTILSLDQVDAGIIWHFYQTEAPDQVEIVWLKPEQLTGIGEMQAATTQFSKDKMSARQFIDYLTSPEGETIFKKHGYIVDSEEANKKWHCEQ